MSPIAREIRAQAERFAQNHLASDGPALIKRVDDPEAPGHLTYILTQPGEAVVLIDVDSDHVLEDAVRTKGKDGSLLESIRRAARCIYIDPYLANHLRLPA